MSIDFRLPNITAKDEAGQLKQVQSFLYQLVEQLNYAMKAVDGGSSGSVVYSGNTHSSTVGEEDAKTKATFNSIKSLIIKSADIVNAYYEEINHKLSGLYVAKSDYGEFVEETSKTHKETSQTTEDLYKSIQNILSDIEGFENYRIEVDAHIKSGILYYGDDGAPMYGLEIGQKTEINGEETFNKYAQFTSEKLTFYDSNGNDVAYISDKKLYITQVEITGSFTLGGFVDTVLPDRGVVTKWEGTGG